MSKYDYLHALYHELISVEPMKRNEIMRDLENRFKEADDNGFGELSVTNELGSPTDYAKQFLNPDTSIKGERDLLSEKQTENTKSVNKTLTEKFQEDVSKIHQEFQLSSNAFGLTLENEPVEDDKPLKKTVLPTTYNDLSPVERPKVYTTPQPVRRIQSSKDPIKMLVITLGLFLLNSIFVLGPFITIWALIITFVATGFALSIGGIGILLSGVFAIPMSFVSVPILIINHPILLFCFGFMLLGFGGLLSIAMIYSIRFFGILTARYASWNLRLIRGF